MNKNDIWATEKTLYQALNKERVQMISARDMRVPLTIKPGENFVTRKKPHEKCIAAFEDQKVVRLSLQQELYAASKRIKELEDELRTAKITIAIKDGRINALLFMSVLSYNHCITESNKVRFLENNRDQVSLAVKE